MTTSKAFALSEQITAGYTGPRGFRFAGTQCGIKRTRSDLGVILSDTAVAAAGCFTKNPVRAPCVDRNASLLPSSEIVAVVVNSGNANAMNGEQGTAANRGMAEDTATSAGLRPDQVLTLSTGMIGIPLNGRVIAKAIPRLLESATADPMPFAEAIMTTDTCTKVAHIEVLLPGDAEPVRLLGIAKGSGMIHPNMATTFGFVCTDAAVTPPLLQELLSDSIDDTFNSITVDGDTSTNDTVLVLANGKSGNFVEGPERIAAFRSALHAVLQSLAIQVARDGEGATRLLQVDVTGAPSKQAARALARGICRGSLFKCSVFAGHAEWGRLAAAAGQAALDNGVAIKAEDVSISVQGIKLVERGKPCEDVKRGEVQRRLRAPEVRWTLELELGDGFASAWGCDLSYDYVRINADEARQVEVSPTGTVARNLTLAAYSPRLKHQLLVDGLAYVRRFMGVRTLIYVHGTAARRFDLVASLAQDLELVLDAGMRPLLVIQEEDAAKTIAEHMRQTGHFSASVPADAGAIGALLDKGHLCILMENAPEPGEVIDLAIKLAIQKLIALGDDQGLYDRSGLVSVMTPEILLAGIDRSRFETTNPEFLAIGRQGAVRGIPALHLIDGRIPHALVGELFTDQGIGTLVTRQTA